MLEHSTALPLSHFKPNYSNLILNVLVQIHYQKSFLTLLTWVVLILQIKGSHCDGSIHIKYFEDKQKDITLLL